MNVLKECHSIRIAPQESSKQKSSALYCIKNLSLMNYRGYIIERSLSYSGGYDFFLENNGRDDCTKHAQSIREAMDSIDDMIASEEPLEPPFKVRMNGEVYPFERISDAIGFSELWRGKTLFQINAI